MRTILFLMAASFSLASWAALPSDVIDDDGADQLVPVPLTWSQGEDDARAFIDQGKALALRHYAAAEKAFSLDAFSLRDKAAQYYSPQADENLPGHQDKNPVTVSDGELVQRIAGSLKDAEVRVPPDGKNFRGCHNGVLAYVKKAYNGRIYVCRKLAYSKKTVEYLAQTLVHEAVHTTGIHDECVTSQVELAVMRQSTGGVVYRNGYWSICDLPWPVR